MERLIKPRNMIIVINHETQHWRQGWKTVCFISSITAGAILGFSSRGRKSTIKTFTVDEDHIATGEKLDEWLDELEQEIRFFIRYADMKDAMLISVISVSDIYAKISVYEIKIGTLNAPLIFHLKI